ncbi:hypothetical protein [Fusobacterium ulcerans]|uniref:hypothetical protein n=1 Tax=Fusobacterium ulcerans TaxID=861 RepID=UPI0026EB895E|nr:hypothetical protein [Fusobacterium ulcerans]
MQVTMDKMLYILEQILTSTMIEQFLQLLGLGQECPHLLVLIHLALVLELL